MQFLEWDFSQDLSAAVHVVSAGEIRFTRAERSLLQAFMSYRGRIWTRDDLLDAVAGVDSEASDRSIDFLISRLRRKLGDSARHPRYIETRYGEGYVWIAESLAVEPGAQKTPSPIRACLRGNAVMSYCDRPDAERAVIQQHADRVRVIRLQGFLFYGAANQLLDEMRREIDRRLDYLILDFCDVLGVDDSALPALKCLLALARECQCKLAFAAARPVIEQRLKPLEAPRFACLDKALEWRETQILETRSVEVPAELTLAGYLAESLDSADVATILRYFEILAPPAQTDIITAATYTRGMFFLERGTVEVLLHIEGTWVRASRIWPGTLFGEIGFHCGGPRTASLRALEPCRLVRMERAAVARLEKDSPALAIRLHRFLARCAATRLIFYNDMVVDFFRNTLR